jgi:ParB family chromosome partitioning protein
LRTQALALELSKNPTVALVAIVHTLAHDLFYRGNGKPYDYMSGDSCIRIAAQHHAKRQTAQDEDNHGAFVAMDERHVALTARLPDRYGDLWAWLLQQPEPVLLELLAFCVASQIEASYRDRRGSEIVHSDQIAAAINFDMTQHWRVSKGFLSRISKKTIASAATEAGCSPDAIKAIGGASKGDAVAIALDAMKDRAWLAPMLRSRLATASATEAGADDEAFDDETTHDEGGDDKVPAEFADDGHDEADALASVYGADDAGDSLADAAE